MSDQNLAFFYQTGLLGLVGDKVDAIDFYTSEIDKLSEEVSHTFCIIWSTPVDAWLLFQQSIIKRKTIVLTPCQRRVNNNCESIFSMKGCLFKNYESVDMGFQLSFLAMQEELVAFAKLSTLAYSENPLVEIK